MDDKTLALILWWSMFASCLLMVILVVFATWWLRLAGMMQFAYLAHWAYAVDFKKKREKK